MRNFVLGSLLSAFALFAVAEVVNMELKLVTLTPETISEDFQDVYDVEERRMGRLEFSESDFVLYTVEKPFLANPYAPGEIDPGIPYESSVSKGEYDVVLRYSPSRGGERWHFYNPEQGVYLEESDTTKDWHRFSTMFHAGNFVSSVVGCAAPGMRFHDFGGSHGLGVASSKLAMSKLNDLLKGEDRHKLLII